ncbi:DUF3393 domain-containing protein [Parashewanella spongiae]|uniref:DUF3393 domain-containing protein n=2 Tax=Parashewanella spongiae TaxID=342950 RepID=A0A3A6U3E8_9GAMM|nr:DUF3393 domain-containing protein [Parashewanella spongiae]
MQFQKNSIIPLLVFVGFTQSTLATDEDFELFLKQEHSEFAQFQQQHIEEFGEFVTAWQQAETQYKKQIGQKWDKALLPSKKVWVSYSDDLNTRTSIDYDTGKVKIEFKKINSNLSPTIEAKNVLKKIANQSTQQALSNDPVYQSAEQTLVKKRIETSNKVVKQTFALENEGVKLLSPVLVQQAIAEKAPVVTYGAQATSVTFALPKQSLPQKAKPFLKEVSKQARRWHVSPSLLLAIIHTESSFNPMARSPIPAFGLMQIVPTTAGKDVSALMHGKPMLYSPEYLYQSSNNIEAGSAYLHILDQRYFKAVRNATSRKYLCIAAYNTGIGNVAKTLTGTNSLNRAAIAANLMSPQQLHQKLLRNLPAEETRNYLRKVLKRSDDYEQQIKGI